jgi:hypothetical protein
MKNLVSFISLAGTLSACADAPPAGPVAQRAVTVTAADRASGRIALVDWSTGRPRLFVQNTDGSSSRQIQFEHVHDRIPGNLSPRQLPVNGSTIISLGPMRWSPDGSKLAVVVSAGFDQSMVVITNADGHNQYVASNNWQYIMGQVEWSPDGSAIAYGMSTLPGARGVDLFVTELPRLTIRRLTKTGDFGLAAYRWDAEGRGLFYVVQEGMDEELWNPIGHIERIDVQTLESQPHSGRLVGTIQGIARDGAFALVMRHRELTPDFAWISDLVRVPIRDDRETVLATSDRLLWASLLDDDATAAVAQNVARDRYETLYGYELWSLDGSVKSELRGIGTAVNVIDVFVR